MIVGSSWLSSSSVRVRGSTPNRRSAKIATYERAFRGDGPPGRLHLEMNWKELGDREVQGN